MRISRRQFLKGAVIGGVGLALPSIPFRGNVRGALAFYQSPGIPLFKTALRGAGPGGIPVALPGAMPAPVTGVTHYNIGIIQFQDQIVPKTTGLGPTSLWGYAPIKGLGGNIKPTHLSGIIIAKGRSPGVANDKQVPIQISFQNLLLFANKHIIPVDTTLPGANQAVNRTAVHLHGGLVPWISDGGPFDWFGPLGDHGLSFLNNQVLNPIHLPGSAEYYYPMNQSARFMWYHDHAFGITRLNAYAGVASGMLVRDGFEAGLIDSGLPNYIEAGGNELPIVIQDKIFVGPDIKTKDPKWVGGLNLQSVTRNPGSLWYAHTYEPNQIDGSGRWDLGPGGLPLPDPSAIPEFFGDTMLVNGTTFPEATVQARRYRLRLLNACNARFLNLQLYIDDGSPNGITLETDPNNVNFGNPRNTPFVNGATTRPTWLQIGTEGGFLASPKEVPSNTPFLITDPEFLGGGASLDPSQIQKSLIVGPAERPDLIVDFRTVSPGTKVILYNDAPSPFPSGDDRNDYFPGWNTQGQNGNPPGAFGLGNPVNGLTQPGFGPNTRVLMRFSVVAASGQADKPLAINTSTNLAAGIDPTLLPTWGFTNDSILPFTKRFLSLNEYFDEFGRLIQILGNAHDPFGSPYDAAATYLNYGLPPGSKTTVGASVESVHHDDTEVWEIYNTTGDVHPMHFHLVNVQVINRQKFDPLSYPYVPSGDIIPPLANEVGWKETVPMYPGTVTRVIMKFELPVIVDKKLRPVSTKAKGAKGCIQLPIKDGQPPASPRTGGNEYVWHCHILEHEEHDMMHALVVT
ncbi:MAG TPA: multicopper oxidase domain-containing protein [Syntrophorhabdaceae bacterium]|jgi:spore coat protein A